MRIPLLDARRASDLANPDLPPKDVALLADTRSAARALFRQIVEEFPPESVRWTNGQECARWTTGSTLAVASQPQLGWWRGRRFGALMLDATHLDLDTLAEIAPAFATAN